MKAIVVVLVPSAEANTSSPQPGITLQCQAESSCSVAALNARTDPACTDSMPPFWTWFIQNPRPVRRP